MADPVSPAVGAQGPSGVPPQNSSSHSGHKAEGGSASFSDTLSQAVGATSLNQPNHSSSHTHGDGAGGRPPKMMSPTSSHPSHFAHDNNKNHDFQQKVVGLRAYQMQLIAANIANADTPNYKAVDVDFGAAAESLTAGMGGALELSSTTQGHIKSKPEKQRLPTPLFRTPYEDSADGNTVDMDVERQKMAESSIMFQFSLDRVSGHFKHMLELFQNLK